jgi:uncharacterized protein (TIGR02217 family)
MALPPFAEIVLERPVPIPGDPLNQPLIVYETQGGPGFNTNVVVVNSGYEQRDAVWSASRGKWEYGERKMSGTELMGILSFFKNRLGKFQGFRLRDWADYKLSATQLTSGGIITQGVLGTGVAVSATLAYQINKLATDAAGTTYERIAKPSFGATKVYVNGVLKTVHVDYEIDESRGVVTFHSQPSVGATLTVDGTFERPVRFDTDTFKSRLDSALPTYDVPPQLGETYHYLFTLPIIEIRVP